MSTNFLNRRMDLIHSVVDDINYLTMDTSYPVKLAGLVIKLFTATQNYNKQQFVICNSDKEEILTISTDKIYDFAGRVINDSIGIEEAYKSEEDVYIKDDYVMVIIDFNDKNIHLCSQSNFKMFITAGVDDFCNFKLFDITGDTEVEGFDYPINVDEFDNAYNFEQKKVGHHSFLRHDKDDVVYQVPELLGTGDDAERSMIPVANVENININKLNVSISQLTFPFINIPSGDCGLDNVSSIMSYYTINGSVNDKFIEEYCFTYDEILNLGLVKNLTDIYNNQIMTEINMIPEDKKNNYVYVVRANCYNNSYDRKYLEDTVIITAIDKDTKSFCNYMIYSNNGIYCGNSNVSIPIKNLEAYNLIGNWWSSDSNNGFYFYIFKTDFGTDIFSAGIQITRGNNSKLITNTYDGTYSTENISGTYYIDYVNNKSSILSYTNDEAICKRIFNSLASMRQIDRIIKFFANGDDEYYEYFICHCLSPSFSAMIGLFTLSYYDPDTKTYDSCDDNNPSSPICVVGLYPQLFDRALFYPNSSGSGYEDTNIHNFTSFHNDIVPDVIDGTNRTKYKYSRYNATVMSSYYDTALVYELIDRNCTSGYYKEHDDNYLKVNITNITDEDSKKFKYIANRSLNPKSYSNFVIKRNKTGDIDDLLMCDMVSVIMPNCINTPYKGNELGLEYNNAELLLHNFVVNKEIKLASQHIEISSDNKLKFHPNGINDSEKVYDLYFIQNNGSNEFSYVQADNNFKSSNGSDQEGLCYLYYIDESSEYKYIHRLKYFYDKNSTESGIPKFDYFTNSILFAKNDKDGNITIEKLRGSRNSTHIFIRAFLNQYMAAYNINDSAALSAFSSFRNGDNWYEILIQVIKAYHFFPYNISNASEDKKQTIVNFFSTSFSKTNTAQLTIGIDEMVSYPAKINNRFMNDGTGYRLKDMLNNDKILLYQNSAVPYVSDIKDANGSYIYSIRNYVNFIKNHKVNEYFNTIPFKYLNGIGIRDEYYKDTSIYDFYNYILTRDLSKPIANTTYSKVNADRAFFKKKIIERINNKIFHADDEGNYHYYFIDSNNNEFSLTVKDDNGMTLNANIDTHNIFGFNESGLMDSNNNNITENYTNVEKVNMNVVNTGLKKIYTISMSDDLYNTSMLPVSGSSDSIDADTLNWNDLLLALNNDKNINILSESLMRIKTELNDYIVDNAQNINDTVSITDNNNTKDNANSHDDVFDKYPEYYKEKNAEFDEKHNVYKFNYGYGFNNNDIRISNNRGVIVLVSDGGVVRRDKHGSVDDPTKFTYSYDSPTKIYPKRMYVSKDGLLCTKEYYDAEITNNSDTIITIRKLEERIAALEERLGI